jgi:hypothetical protein
METILRVRSKLLREVQRWRAGLIFDCEWDVNFFVSNSIGHEKKPILMYIHTEIITVSSFERKRNNEKV